MTLTVFESPEGFEIATAADRDGLLEAVDAEVTGVWPEFMLHDTVANQHWARLYSEFPEYQLNCLIEARNEISGASSGLCSVSPV